jgi:hypothetical protein
MFGQAPGYQYVRAAAATAGVDVRASENGWIVLPATRVKAAN